MVGVVRALMAAEATLRRDQLAATGEIYFSPQARPGYFDQELSRLPARRSRFMTLCWPPRGAILLP